MFQRFFALFFYFSLQARDDLVIKLVRKFQGEVLKRIRGRIYQKKYDQRSNLTNVIVWSLKIIKL